MNWLADGRTDRFRYVRVAWPDMTELGEVDGVTGATIKESTLTSLKASGEVEYANPIDIGDDLLRIYSVSRLGDEAETVCHGTFFVTTPSSSWSGVVRSGKADMFSVLWILQQNKTTETFTAQAGENAVALAESLAGGHGNNLPVVATASPATLNASHTWDAGTTYLDIVNWLLDFAGYNSISCDAYGNALMTPYVDPADKAVGVVFSDTRDSVSEPGFTHELDAFEIPNKVTVICSNADSEPMVAHAVNDDPENPYSIAARRKLLVRVETVSDIASQEALDAKARELLRTSMSVVETVEVKHSYQSFCVGDAIQMDYSKAGYAKKLISVSREMQMVPGIRCTTRARRFVNLMKGE